MKLRKVTINGKTYYEEINENNVIEPEVINKKHHDEDELKFKKNKREQEYESNSSNRDNYESNFEKSYEKNNTDGGNKWKKDWKDFLERMKGIGKNISKSVSKATKDLFQDTDKTLDTTNRLVKILPYMKEKDIHDIVKRILRNDKEFKNLDYAAIMPFMTPEDCDALFMKMIRDDKEINMKVVHFVSQDCLSCLVDAYICGRFPDLDVDTLYPFLSSEDVKKLFYYELRRK